MSDNIDQLCRAAQAGDVVAATELLEIFYGRIYAYFRRLCANEADAADLTQRTFAKVWASIGSFSGRSSFSTWLHGIARHVYLDWRRRKDRLEQTDDAWWHTQRDPQAGPLELTAERELAAQVFSLVEQLDEDAREAVHLHYYQELTLQQTAEVLGVSAGTVKYRLRRALDFLKKHVNESNHISD